ncbi:MAG: chemotaxis protein CheR [Treponema sp.]|jgi:chemotaxis protein methyltransferase CheR|nr:chemotaxis protein CheR [Treponema sp.]
MNTPCLSKDPEPSETFPRDPELYKLYCWVEQTLGIRAAEDGLIRLRDYFITRRGPSYEDRLFITADELFTAAQLFTVNETYFFREENHFVLLQKEILPRFAQLNRPIRICSAASSIGCEAYSLAMLMDHYSRTIEPLRYWIDAFDVSREVIETARLGFYTENALREDGSRWKRLLDQYLQPQGGRYRIDPRLKKYTHFFTYNIMNPLPGEQYDLIFFRNALIYFAPDFRSRVLDNLSQALFAGGFLFLGVSETAGVNHPLLESRSAEDVFYFQRRGDEPLEPEKSVQPRGGIEKRPGEASAGAGGPGRDRPRSDPASRSAAPEPRNSQPADPGLVAALIEDEGGRPTAQRVLSALGQGRRPLGGPEASGGSTSELTAAAVYLLGIEDDPAVESVLSRLEDHDDSAFTYFLRGEYFYLKHNTQEAETRYKVSAWKNPAFWPAYYRISMIAAEGNRTLYEYKVKKALESIDLGKDQGYESFIGGFSPDYYRQILTRRLGNRGRSGVN